MLKNVSVIFYLLTILQDQSYTFDEQFVVGFRGHELNESQNLVVVALHGLHEDLHVLLVLLGKFASILKS